MINKRGIGSDYEKQVAEYLKDKGYEILEMNFHSRMGELDIIARNEEYLVFCEVKYRRDKKCGDPLEAVDYRKQRKVCQTALYYCMKHGYGDSVACRFDVIALEGEKITHIENAFEFQV